MTLYDKHYYCARCAKWILKEKAVKGVRLCCPQCGNILRTKSHSKYKRSSGKRLKRFCCICGKNIDNRKINAKYCKKCAYEKRETYKRKYMKEYRKTRESHDKDYYRRYGIATKIYKKECNEKCIEQ